MFKRHGKIILIIILIIQLSVPFSFLIYQANINKHLNEGTEYIKININSIWYDSLYTSHPKINITLNLNNTYSEEYYESNYLNFNVSKNNEYSEMYFSNIITPDNKHYIHQNSFFELEHICYDTNNKFPDNISYLEIYDKINELKNVANGYSTGDLTEAYAILKIYKNHYKIEEIYIDGYTLDEFITLYSELKIDISRFHHQDNYDYYNLTKSDYLKYIDEEKIFLYDEFLKYTEDEVAW